MSFYDAAPRAKASRSAFGPRSRRSCPARSSSSASSGSPGIDPGASYRLSDVDLATRLSFFLWGTAPDEELLELARADRLSDPEVLERAGDADARRILARSRSPRASLRSGSGSRTRRTTSREPYLYPDFTAQLATSWCRETELFFEHLVREDRSLLELVHRRLHVPERAAARHYGIPGVVGRRVPCGSRIPDDTRRGILGHGSVLLATSMSARTSPVLRGKWVMEVLMGTPPPPPPPNVPAFDDTRALRAAAVSPRGSGWRCTARTRPATPATASWTRSASRSTTSTSRGGGDPRERSRRSTRAARSTTGRRSAAPRELVEVLLEAADPAGAELHREPAGVRDRPARRVLRSADDPGHRAGSAKANDYRMSSFILGVVKSDAFQMRQVDQIPSARPRRRTRAMNFITGKHLSRRTFLRGAGVERRAPVPGRDGPRRDAPGATAAERASRASSASRSRWDPRASDWGDSAAPLRPAGVGRDFELGAESQLKPLEAYREYLTVVSNTDCRMAEAFRAEEIGGDHDRTTCVFLTQSHPKQTQGRTSTWASRSTRSTRSASGRTRRCRRSSSRTEGIDRAAAARTTTTAPTRPRSPGRRPNQPLPAIREPRVVFEQLFGAGDTRGRPRRPARGPTERARLGRGRDRPPQRELGAVDRAALDEYTTHIRELERRIELVEAQNSSGEERRCPRRPPAFPTRGRSTWS